MSTTPKRGKKQPRAGKARALLLDIRAPDGTVFTMPVWQAQADLIDAAQVMTATAITATARGVRFDLVDRAQIWHEASHWRAAWAALGLPESIDGGAAVADTCRAIEAWHAAQPRRRGQRGLGKDHAEMDELIATALVKIVEGQSHRAAVAATLEELAPDMPDNRLHVAMKRALRDSKGCD